MTAPKRLQLKLYSKQGWLDKETVIQQFHSWIQNDQLDEIAIDVADYSHVVDGPGILLITHEADYAFDEVGGPGLRYVRKKQMPATLEQAILLSYSSLLEAAYRLEHESSGVSKFDLTRIEVTLLDRRMYPNVAQTEEVVRSSIAQLFESLFNATEVSVSRVSEDERYPLALRISAPHGKEINEIREAIHAAPVLVPIL